MSQSVLARAPSGFFTAAAMATLAGPYPVVAQIALARLRQGPVDLGVVGQGVAVLALTLLSAQAVCLAFGAPIWITLRLARRESALAYGGAGLLVGLCWATTIFGKRVTSQPQIWPIIGWISLASCAAAATFWRVVRQPVVAVLDKPRGRAGR